MQTSRRAGADARTLSTVHVTTTHQALDTRVFLKECRTLAAAGHRVFLVVPHDGHYVQDGVVVRGIHRPFGRFDRWWRTGREAFSAAVSTEAEVVHLHDPELIPHGWLFKLMGKRVIYDAHENRPLQILSKTWIPALLRRPVAWLTRMVEAASARVFDLVIAATPEIAGTFPPHRTALVQNFPLVDEFAAVGRRPAAERPAHIVFVGGITPIRGAEQMVTAMSLLPPELGARLQLVGEFAPPSLRQALEGNPGWSAVSALGFQSRGAVADLLEDARAGLVLYHPEPNHVGAQPNKLFEYMSAGLPVIASDFPLWRAIVGHADCGMLVDPLDPQAIAEAMTRILRHPAEAQAMGLRGRRAVQEEFNWGTQAEALLAGYARLRR